MTLAKLVVVMHNQTRTRYTIFAPIRLLHKRIMDRRTEIQSRLAIASFVAGVVMACICLFAVPPYGEISNSAISIVSEMLVLCGALLGIKTTYDIKLDKFESELNRKVDKGNEE